MSNDPLPISSSPDAAVCLARLGREIRNSMHLTLGLAEILLETDLAPSQREYLNVLRENADRLLSTTGDLVALGTDEGAPVFHVDFDLIELLDQTTELLQSLAGSSGGGPFLELHLHPDLERRVSGNRRTLEELLIAILGTATRSGLSGVIALTATPSSTPGATLFTISMPTLAKSSADLPRGVEELDIHFALARKLALKIGGELLINTNPAVTVVSFIALMVPLAPGSAVSPRIGGASQDASEEPLRVLLAEDAADSRYLMLAYLKGQNCVVDIAIDGAIALVKVQATEYDIVFMDLDMPEMGGVESTRRIREYEQSTNRGAVPIVALTAHTHAEIAKRCVNSGFSAYMAKPVTRKAILGALTSYTARRRDAAGSGRA